MLGAIRDRVSRLFRGEDDDGAERRGSSVTVERLDDEKLTDTEKVAILDDLYDQGLRARSGREEEWFKRLYHYAGEHYCVWDSGRRSMKARGREPSWMIRETWNEIRPTVDHAVALRVRDMPDMIAVASNDDGFDVAASEAGTEALEHVVREQRIRTLRTAVRRLSDICGTSALEPEWDESAGPYAAMPPEGQPGGEMAEPDGSGFWTEEGFSFVEKPLGDLRINILSPFEIVPDPACTGDFDGDWICTIREVSAGWARARFPQYREEIQPEDVDERGPDDGVWFLRLYQEFGRQYGGAGGAELRDSVLLRKFYRAPCPRWPRGRCYLVIGQSLVWEGDNPIAPDDLSAPRGLDRWPVFVFRHRWTGKCFWGDSLVEDLIKPQATLNRLISKALAIIYSTQRPIIATHPNVRIGDEPCPIIRTEGGNTLPENMLHMWPAPTFPDAIMQFIDRAITAIQRAGGIHDATRGQAPGADSSGVLVQSLQEQDQSRLGPVKVDEDLTEGRMARYLLMLVARHWSTERAIRTLGPNLETAVRMLKGADLSAGTDVWVMQDNALPHDRRSTWLLVSQLLQAGLFEMPATTKQQVFRLLRLGGGKQFLSEESSADTRARRMISRLEQGLPQQVAFYDDYGVLVDRMRNWMRSEKYEQLALRNPGIKANAEQVLAAALVGQQMAAAQQAAYGPGAAGAVPAPPPAPGQGAPPQAMAA